MSQRINYLVYFFGSILVGMGIARFIANMAIFGIHLSIEYMVPSLIIALVGLLMLTVGILSMKENMKSATIYSILLISCVMVGIFIYYVLFESSIWKKFLSLTVASVSVTVISHKMCAKTGTYDIMNKLNPWYRGRVDR
jgi:uncharacterized membrane protein